MSGEEPKLSEILVRLEKLERQNRNLRRGATAVGLLLATLVIMGQAKTDKTLELDIIKAHHIYASTLEISDKDDTTLLVPGFITVQNTSKAKNLIYITSVDGPTVQLTDKEGFQSTLGAASLLNYKNGSKENTSAATITLFDTNKTVIWKAP